MAHFAIKETLNNRLVLLDGQAELPEPPFRYTDGAKTGANWGINGRQKSVSLRVSVDPENRAI